MRCPAVCMPLPRHVAEWGGVLALERVVSFFRRKEAGGVESLMPRDVEEALMCLREAWSLTDYGFSSLIWPRRRRPGGGVGTRGGGPHPQVKAPNLVEAVGQYYVGDGRNYKELAYLEVETAEAVLDVKAARRLLEQYEKEGRQIDLAIPIALAYRAAKIYQRHQHKTLGELAHVVAEICRIYGLRDRRLQ
ncbi:MAG: hypothetical protein ABWK05_06090 [Pyrobaculum sp.]